MEEKIKEDLKQAQLQRDELKVSTLRLLISEITNTRIQKQADLSDEDIVSVIRKEAKKRKEAIEAYTKGGNSEAADKEGSELKILEEYLPAQMSDEELTKIVEDVINSIGGASGMADMGKVIGAVMGKTQGMADGGRVSAIAKQKLQ